MSLQRATWLFLLASLVRGQDQWAVLVAGSKGWRNYRHQAGVCHAHKVLRDRGFQEDKIITMVYDDLAQHSRNPIPGKVFNAPAKTLEEAVDVYEGCNPDYTRYNVTPETFLAVLLGDAKKAGGKVLRSGSQDNVFVNFVDHGAVGLVAFPNVSEKLHARPLLQTLMTMAEQQRFKSLLFYMEACESGSMFKDLLPANLSISAVTSASPYEPGYGTYCGKKARIGNKSFYTCLGDEFGVNWMRNSEQGLPQQTVDEQFLQVRNATKKSHVQLFGQRFKKAFLSEFQGPGGRSAPASEPPSSNVNSRDVKLEILREEYERTGDKKALAAEIKDREAAAALQQEIVGEVLGRQERLFEEAFAWTWPLLECHEKAADLFGEVCGWTENRLALSKTLFQLCQRQVPQGALLAGIRRACEATKASAALFV